MLGEVDGGVLIRNLAGRGKHRIETVEHVIEPDLLYPLLRWGDVGRYSATPRAYLLLVQAPATRSGIEESVMQAKYPRTLAYLERFRDLLSARAPIAAISRAARSMRCTTSGRTRLRRSKSFGGGWIGGSMPRWLPTACPVGQTFLSALLFKLHEADRMSAPPRRDTAAADPARDVRAGGCDSSDEAHYLCALLNSAAVNELVAAHTVRGGKGFGTPGMFDFLPLRRYRPDDPRHAELVALSRQAHRAAGSQPAASTELRQELQCRVDLQPPA